MEHNFAQHIADGDDVGPYDFGSIMHYPTWAFSHNNQPTIETLNGEAIGQRDSLSDGDVQAINFMYPGKILFYNAADGLGATARLDAGGNYTFVSTLPGFATGWTHIVGASNGGVLFYNASTGLGATARLDAGGNYTFVSSLPGFAPWTHIAGL